MLLERVKNKYEINEIVSFKMVNGDEVLGRLTSLEDGHYELNKPCIVVTSPEGIGLIQAMFGLDPDKENLIIRDQHIISTCRTHEKMRDHYITVTTREA